MGKVIQTSKIPEENTILVQNEVAFGGYFNEY